MLGKMILLLLAVFAATSASAQTGYIVFCGADTSLLPFGMAQPAICNSGFSASSPMLQMPLPTNMLQLRDWEWGASNSMTIGSATGGAGAGKVAYPGANVTLDGAAPVQLWTALNTGRSFTKVLVLETQTSGASRSLQVLGLHSLGNVRVSSIQHVFASGAGVSNWLSLVAVGSVGVSTFSQDASGKPVAGGSFCWDVARNAASSSC